MKSRQYVPGFRRRRNTHIEPSDLLTASSAGRVPGSHVDFPSTLLQSRRRKQKDAYPAATGRIREISDGVFPKPAH
jgi:hypothetical protein